MHLSILRRQFQSQQLSSNEATLYNLRLFILLAARLRGEHFTEVSSHRPSCYKNSEKFARYYSLIQWIASNGLGMELHWIALKSIEQFEPFRRIPAGFTAVASANRRTFWYLILKFKN